MHILDYSKIAFSFDPVSQSVQGSSIVQSLNKKHLRWGLGLSAYLKCVQNLQPSKRLH